MSCVVRENTRQRDIARSRTSRSGSVVIPSSTTSQVWRQSSDQLRVQVYRQVEDQLVGPVWAQVDDQLTQDLTR
jgi:hypothetical protein